MSDQEQAKEITRQKLLTEGIPTDAKAVVVNHFVDPNHFKYGMTVGDLREALADLPDDALVIMSKDGEGNRYSPLCETEKSCWYTPDSTWSGERHEIYTGPLVEGIEDDEDIHLPVLGEDIYAICLWPIN